MSTSNRIPVDITKPYLGTISVKEMNRILGAEKSRSRSRGGKKSVRKH